MSHVIYERLDDRGNTEVNSEWAEPELIEYTPNWLFIYETEAQSGNPRRAIPRERIIEIK